MVSKVLARVSCKTPEVSKIRKGKILRSCSKGSSGSISNILKQTRESRLLSEVSILYVLSSLRHFSAYRHQRRHDTTSLKTMKPHWEQALSLSVEKISMEPPQAGQVFRVRAGVPLMLAAPGQTGLVMANSCVSVHGPE